MTDPNPQQFFGYPSEHASPEVTFVGVPWEAPQARSGSQAAPGRLRQLSERISSYSPLLDKDLSEVQGHDNGDLPPLALEGSSIHQETYQQIGKQGSAPILVGGDLETASPLITELAQQHDELMVLQLSAHPFGLTSKTPPLEQASALQHQDVLVYGLRSGAKEDFAEARRCRVCGPFPSYDHQRLTALRYHLETVHYRPLLLLCDLSVFDPAVAPGATRPDPGGIQYEEFRQMLHHLKGRNVVGAAVTGCSPQHDPSETTLYLAAKVLREVTLLVASRPTNDPSNA